MGNERHKSSINTLFYDSLKTAHLVEIEKYREKERVRQKERMREADCSCLVSKKLKMRKKRETLFFSIYSIRQIIRHSRNIIRLLRTVAAKSPIFCVARSDGRSSRGRGKNARGDSRELFGNEAARPLNLYLGATMFAGRAPPTAAAVPEPLCLRAPSAGEKRGGGEGHTLKCSR